VQMCEDGWLNLSVIPKERAVVQFRYDSLFIF